MNTELRHGMLFDEPLQIYHAAPCISHTKIKFFSENFPITYRQKYIDKCLEPEGEKEHFDVGQACEAACTSLATFETQVVVCPYGGFTTKVAREWRDEHRSAGFVPLSADNGKLVGRMRDAVLRNPDAAALLAAGTPQVTFRAKGAVVDAQCRCDWYCPAGATLPSDGIETGPVDVDMKTCDSLHPSAFVGFDKHAIQLKYHWAEAWYAHVIRRVLATIAGQPEDELPFLKRYYIVVDKKEWPSCSVYTMPGTMFEIAERDLFADDPLGMAKKLIACYARNDWPDAPIRKEIELPKWV